MVVLSNCREVGKYKPIESGTMMIIPTYNANIFYSLLDRDSLRFFFGLSTSWLVQRPNIILDSTKVLKWT